MQIPIENIYYLLCYAWNKLEEKDRVDIDARDYTELLNLFTKVLINATTILLKRGIDRYYTEATDEIIGIKGKLELAPTLKRNILHKQKTICTFDDFSPNTIPNRILITTIQRLLRTRSIDNELKNELYKINTMFIGITPIDMTHRLFESVKLHRNNRFYGFVLNVCQIIYENTLPSEEKGHFKFSDFTRDERKMNKLFEAFIRNFYRLEQSRFNTVKKETIYWKFNALSDSAEALLPRMETDITLENTDEKIIIDAKYYRETMDRNYGVEKVRSANLYQLYSYLMQQKDGSQKNDTATGILLYPTINEEYNLDYKYFGHNIQIRTVNLNANWRHISSRLLEIIKAN